VASFREHLRSLGFEDMATAHREVALLRTTATHLRDKLAAHEAAARAAEASSSAAATAAQQHAAALAAKLAAVETRRREVEAQLAEARAEVRCCCGVGRVLVFTA
jgi:hypothetical protein